MGTLEPEPSQNPLPADPPVKDLGQQHPSELLTGRARGEPQFALSAGTLGLPHSAAPALSRSDL